MAEFKVTDYGVTPGGNPTVNRQALQALLDGPASNGGRVIAPGDPQPYLYDAQVIGQHSNVTLEGEGEDTRFLTTSLTDNLLALVGTAAAPLYNFHLEGIALGSTVTKSSGAALFARYTARTLIRDVMADPRETSTWNLWDGIHFDRLDDVEVDGVNLNARHWALAANGDTGGGWGADLYVHGGSKLTNAPTPSQLIAGAAGIYLGGSVGGFSIADTDVVYCGTGMLIDKLLTGTHNDEIFLNPGTFIDSCGWDGIDLAGDGCSTLQATGLWLASHGIISGGFAGGNGINVQPGQSSICEIVFTGGRIFNCQGTGASFNGGEVTVRGTSVTDNGQDRVHGGDGIGLYNSSTTADIDAHCTRNGIGGPNSRGAGLYLTGGVQYGRFAGRYWGNGHYNINNQSGNTTNNFAGAMA